MVEDVVVVYLASSRRMYKSNSISEYFYSTKLRLQMHSKVQSDAFHQRNIDDSTGILYRIVCWYRDEVYFIVSTETSILEDSFLCSRQGRSNQMSQIRTQHMQSHSQ